MTNIIVKEFLTKIVTKALLKVGLSVSNPLGAIAVKILTNLLMNAVEDIKFEIEVYNQYKKDIKEGKEDETRLQNAKTDSDIVDAINNSR